MRKIAVALASLLFVPWLIGGGLASPNGFSNSSSRSSVSFYNASIGKDASLGYDNAPIYRVDFRIDTVQPDLKFNFTSGGMVIYNLTKITYPGVTVNWYPYLLEMQQSQVRLIHIDAIVFAYVDSARYGSFLIHNTIKSNFPTNVSIYNDNTGKPVYTGFRFSSYGSHYNATISNLETLRSNGPVFVTQDKLRDYGARPVLAFYYGWYGTPQKGFYQDWYDGRNGSDKISTAGVPEIGMYNSHNSTIVDEQLSSAQLSGINVFVSSWWGQGTFTDSSTGLALHEAKKFPGFKIAVNYEIYHLIDQNLSRNKALATFVNDIGYIVKTYSANTTYYKIGGIPVVFIYEPDNYDKSFWESAVSQIKSQYNVYLIADTSNLSLIDVFDGYYMQWTNLQWIYQGNMSKLSLAYNTMSVETTLHNKLWFAPARAGEDNINDEYESKVFMPREEGWTYNMTWALAIASEPNGITITSWNEWHEGTNIEPANVSTTPDFWISPDMYLSLTRYWSLIYVDG
jgi:glycoprotein endo-alpha-1,2-mannosidase